MLFSGPGAVSLCRRAPRGCGTVPRRQEAERRAEESGGLGQQEQQEAQIEAQQGKLNLLGLSVCRLVCLKMLLPWLATSMVGTFVRLGIKQGTCS